MQAFPGETEKSALSVPTLPVVAITCPANRRRGAFSQLTWEYLSGISLVVGRSLVVKLETQYYEPPFSRPLRPGYH